MNMFNIFTDKNMLLTSEKRIIYIFFQIFFLLTRILK